MIIKTYVRHIAHLCTSRPHHQVLFGHLETLHALHCDYVIEAASVRSLQEEAYLAAKRGFLHEH